MMSWLHNAFLLDITCIEFSLFLITKELMSVHYLFQYIGAYKVPS